MDLVQPSPAASRLFERSGGDERMGERLFVERLRREVDAVGAT